MNTCRIFSRSISYKRAFFIHTASLYSYNFKSIHLACQYSPQLSCFPITYSPYRAIHTSFRLRGDEQLEFNESVRVTFIDRDGNHVPVIGNIGENLLSLAHRYDIEMEGACDASLACTTCHVYIQPEFFSVLLPSTDEEEDLLDLAPFLESNSRLGCQVLLTRDMQGMFISLPRVTRNFYVDGHIPKAH
ncbi:Adrenodoxin-like protein [Oopsacas minuta]|uniref:Adrenodoxin-like protein n=1 Tax=Oopsacas minuta TaxID=111878 RepID=A0AAV7JBH8_9METZ|nr:Adrenodoxin-like protein [Oopsacas minuta]